MISSRRPESGRPKKARMPPVAVRRGGLSSRSIVGETFVHEDQESWTSQHRCDSLAPAKTYRRNGCGGPALAGFNGSRTVRVGGRRGDGPRSAGLQLVLGGPQEILTDESGATFEPGSASDLAAQLRTIQMDPVLRRRMTVLARTRASDFDISITVRRLEALYADLCQRS